MNEKSLITYDEMFKALEDANKQYKKYLEIKDKFSKKEKAILIIGEYFAKDNYYTSPFNAKNTKELFIILKELAAKYHLKIKIRSRLYDDYYNIAKYFETESFTVSSSKRPIIEDILEHSLIITIFSLWVYSVQFII